jgi:hypothetical protein
MELITDASKLKVLLVLHQMFTWCSVLFHQAMVSYIGKIIFCKRLQSLLMDISWPTKLGVGKTMLLVSATFCWR